MTTNRMPRTLSEAARGVIADVYLVGSIPADPHGVLQDLARGVSVVGRLLNGLADQYAVARKNIASMITIAGAVLWGIVEISVPESELFYLSRYWIKLIAFLGLLIIVLGAITNTKGMPSIGVDLIVGVYLVCVLSRQLHRFMNTGEWAVRRAKKVFVATGILLAVIGTLYLLTTHAQAIASHLQALARFFTWVAQLQQKYLGQ